MTNQNRVIGARLRAARIKADLSQDDAAKLLKMDRSNISHIEQGRSTVGLGYLLQMVHIYRCKITDLLPDDVVTDYDRQRAIDPDLHKIIAAWPELSDNIKHVLLNQFDALLELNEHRKK